MKQIRDILVALLALAILAAMVIPVLAVCAWFRDFVVATCGWFLRPLFHWWDKACVGAILLSFLLLPPGIAVASWLESRREKKRIQEERAELQLRVKRTRPIPRS